LASSTTKTGHHDIAEILLKVALNTIKSLKSNQQNVFCSSQTSFLHVPFFKMLEKLCAK
jgi:hypothetical protein